MTADDSTTYLRDLQAKWERLADRDPLWAVWTDPAHKGRRWTLKAIYTIGEREITRLMRQLGKRGMAFPRGTALDFGCGVGRLTRPLARRFESVVGVDISPTMIGIARSHTVEPHVAYVVNLSSGLAVCSSGRFDFVLSRNTLQHMAPGLIEPYVVEFLRVLSPGGLLCFQLPSTRKASGKDSEQWGPVGTAVDEDDYPRMDMYGIERSKVVGLLEKAGGRVVETLSDATAIGWDGYSYFVRRQ